MTDPLVPPTVLLIDDSPENRYATRRALTRAGLEVAEAQSGAEGLELVAGPTRPDLVILDVNLPDISGYEVCRRLKTGEGSAHIPVIHLSQSAVDDASRVRGLEGGADAYLSQPVGGSVLVATVRALLRMRDAEDELRRQVAEAELIAQLTTAFSDALTGRQVVEALIGQLTSAIAVRRASVYTLRGSRPQLVHAGIADDSTPQMPATALALVDPEAFADGRGIRVLLERQPKPRSWAALPLLAYGHALGILLVEFEDPSAPTVHQEALLRAVSERCGQALERAQLYEEQREIAFQLQASLLPVALPAVAGLELGARHQAGETRMEVGGDFYDLFEGADGWIAIIGDVCGRGASAAALTSLARHTAREAARHRSEPAAILGALQAAIHADPRPDKPDFLTAACLRLRRSGDRFEVTVAIGGHPLPLVASTDGGVREIGEPGLLIGLAGDATFTQTTEQLAPGEVIVLFTDGVTEARHDGVLYGDERLQALVGRLAAEATSAQQIAEQVIADAAAFGRGHDDDMAILTVRVLDARS